MKKLLIVFVILLIAVFTFVGCNSDNASNNPFDNPMDNPGDNPGGDNGGDSGNTNTDESVIVDDNDVKEIEVDESSHNFKLTSTDKNTYTFECQDENCEETYTLKAKCESGTSCITVSDNKIEFGEVTEDTEYSLSGTFYGNIVVDGGDDYEFKLSLEGISITSNNDVPIYFKSGDNTVVSAKKETENYIYDLRATVDEEGTSASIYSKVDLDIQGKGSLYVVSENNNGIHAKDELNVKNLTLQVECLDNSLKGNDGVTIESGSITLISKKGDGIKTSNSHVSSKGKQKGDIKVNGGNLLIYAACDGMDAAHDVIVEEGEGSSVDVQIFTDKYSKYSEEVTTKESSVIYVRYSSTTYKYSIEYSNGSDTTAVMYNSSSYKTQSSGGGGPQGGGTQYYYSIEKPSGYTKMRVFIYSSSQEQGQTTNYLAASDYITINNSYDTFALQANRNGGLSYGWTNYSTSQMGPGGMQEGNSDKGDYSTKGIKADNEIKITSGTITISAYDDAIHTNNDVQLGEEGAYYYGTGNIVINGGTITIHSNDDGIHADGTLTVSGGDIYVTNSYEGFEGNAITISGGETYIKSSDDGMNSTAESGVGVTISGGTIYVYAGGDGIDSNTKTSKSGYNISGGKVIVISTGNADSALDTENGYTYTGGYVVAIGRSGGMSNESTNCSNFSSVATSKTISLTKDSYLVVDGVLTLKMPVSINSFVVVLGKTSASISSSSSSSNNVDSAGVYWAI